jgi:hypothetical protein
VLLSPLLGLPLPGPLPASAALVPTVPPLIYLGSPTSPPASHIGTTAPLRASALLNPTLPCPIHLTSPLRHSVHRPAGGGGPPGRRLRTTSTMLWWRAACGASGRGCCSCMRWVRGRQSGEHCCWVVLLLCEGGAGRGGEHCCWVLFCSIERCVGGWCACVAVCLGGGLRTGRVAAA